MNDLVGFLIRASGLVIVLFLVSRPFRTLFYRRELDRRGQIWYVVFWTLASVLAPFLTVVSAYVPFFAGLFGDTALGGAVGVTSAVWMLIKGSSVPTAIVHLLAGLAGGRLARRLGPGRKLPLYVGLIAGLVSILGLDAPDHPGLWMPLPLVAGGLAQLPYLTVAFSLSAVVFMRAMEFMLTEGERERARTADRVLRLVGDVERILALGLTTEAASDLATLVQRELEVPACFVLVDGGATACGHEVQGPPAGGDHRKFMTCPPGCCYTDAVVVPLQDGLRVVGTLGLLGTRSAALPPSASETVRGLGALLSGHLSEARVRSQKADLETARFQFLQAQIRPHFLFNALNTVAALTTRDPTVARDVVLNLSRVLRESFRQDRPLVSLSEELEVLQAYLKVEQARFGDRLKVVLDVPDPLPDWQIPPFTLQPLVENAVRHGIGEQVAGGVVTVRVAGQRIEVIDTGVGMSVERLQQVLAGGGGVGVSNVRERLASVSWGLSIESRAGEGTQVILTHA